MGFIHTVTEIESAPPCRPKVSANRAGPVARRRGIARWEYFMECCKHGVSEAASRGTWTEAMDLADEHRREVTAGLF